MFEAVHTERISADAEAIWELWADPQRWPDWNEQVEGVELDGELRVGAEVSVKFKRGGKVKFEVTELEPLRLFVDEAKFPGARLGHEHRMKPGQVERRGHPPPLRRGPDVGVLVADAESKADARAGRQLHQARG